MSEELKGLPGLKAARERTGMSQSALARAVEAPERQIQRWERGEASPSVWAALAVAKVLGTTVEALGLGASTDAPADRRKAAVNALVEAIGRITPEDYMALGDEDRERVNRAYKEFDRLDSVLGKERYLEIQAEKKARRLAQPNHGGPTDGHA